MNPGTETDTEIPRPAPRHLWWIEVDGYVQPVNVMAMAAWVLATDQTVGRWEDGGLVVETRFYPTPLGWADDGRPLLYATLVSPAGVYQLYPSREDACDGHARTVKDITGESDLEPPAELAAPPAPDPDACNHARVQVAAGTRRLEATNGQALGWLAGFRLTCLDCGEPFVFRGVKGRSAREPRVSADGKELRAPVLPASDVRSALMTPDDPAFGGLIATLARYGGPKGPGAS